MHDPVDKFAEKLAMVPSRALQRLRDEASSAAIGVGVNATALAVQSVREVPLDCVMPSGRTSLLDLSALDELRAALPGARGVDPGGGVFSSGVLADPKPGALFDHQPAPDAVLERARLIQSVCRGLRREPVRR